MSNKNNKKQIGERLQDGSAHDQVHKDFGRRKFLKNLGLAGGVSLLLGGKTPIFSSAASPFNFLLGSGTSDRVLVLIRLKGGNDGLNTFIPVYDYGTYKTNRQNIAIPQNDLINITNEFGMPKTMSDLSNMWNDGQMKVVSNVGYDDHNLSHFRSTDIITSASDENQIYQSGWLGRYLEKEYPDFLMTPPENPPAIQIGSVGNLTFNGSDENQTNYSISVTSPDELAEIAKNGNLYSLDDVPDCYEGDQVAYLRSVANSTFIYADKIKKAYDLSKNDAEYTSDLGRQLALVARFIKGNLGTKFYVVSIGGFDTHAEQNQKHPQLMNDLAKAVSNFYKDLSKGQKEDDVLCMTFSEFGRRLQQNASQGTDHGTAAPVMLFGGGLNGNGFIGNLPDLKDLDDNENLKYSTDFRSIYATVLEQWLCLDSNLIDTVLGRNFTRLDLGLTCDTVSTQSTLPGFELEHQARYSDNGQIQIWYKLPNTKFVKIEIFNMMGQLVEVIFKGRQTGGSHTKTFNPKRYLSGLSGYIYRIEVNGVGYSGKVLG